MFHGDCNMVADTHMKTVVIKQVWLKYIDVPDNVIH